MLLSFIADVIGANELMLQKLKEVYFIITAHKSKHCLQEENTCEQNKIYSLKIHNHPLCYFTWMMPRIFTNINQLK